MIKNKKELITCVLLTKGDIDLVKNSIQCYLNQIYVKKNLLIISQSEDNSLILDFIDKVNEEITLIPCSSKLLYSDLKNLAVNIAFGEIICDWNENDFFSSERLSIQYNFLKSHNKNSCSLFSSFSRFCKENNELVVYDLKLNEQKIHQFIPTSLMFYKKHYDFFDVFYSSEDNFLQNGYNVISKLNMVGYIGEVNSGEHYISGCKKEEIFEEEVVEKILYKDSIINNKKYNQTNLV